MNYKRYGNDIVVRIDKGEEIIKEMLEVCKKENVQLANVNALGATGEFEIGLFHTDIKKYESKKYKGDFEIVSFTGSITTKEGALYNHIHMSAANGKNEVVGGHLNYAIVSATCEMFIHVIEGKIERKFDENIGLNLFEF